jgi:acid phosphatase (class A)
MAKMLWNGIRRDFCMAYLLLILSLVFFGSVSMAQSGVTLTAEELHLSAFPAPPVAGSAEDVADLNAVRSFQKTRTKADCEMANQDAALDLESIFVNSGQILSADEGEKLQELYNEVFNQTDAMVNEVKGQWMRTRPYLRDTSIALCVPSHPASSYPSGHSAISYASARVFGVLFPARASQLLERANQVAKGRVIGGVHHPVDTQAGQKLGEDVFEALMKKPEFVNYLNQLKTQLP